MIKVNEKLFTLFMGWYDNKISKVRSEIMMISDRINYFNNEDDLIAYISVHRENTYYIKEVYYNLMLLDK